MTKWFDEDEKIQKPKKSSNLIFDEGYTEEDEENIQLMELGIAIALIDQYRSHYKNKNLIYGGKITKQFFEWILKSCNKDELWLIKENYDKYPEKFQKMIDKAEPITLGEESKNDAVWKSEMLEIEEMKKVSEEGHFKQYTRFLYDLLGRFLEQIPEKYHYQFSDIEMKMIKEIDGGLK